MGLREVNTEAPSAGSGHLVLLGSKLLKMASTGRRNCLCCCEGRDTTNVGRIADPPLTICG